MQSLCGSIGRGDAMTLQDYFVNDIRLKREWDPGLNTVTPDNLTSCARTKVWWRCTKGHKWKAAVDSRVSMGRNCPYCANQAVTPGENDIGTVAPEMAKLWHPTKNGDLKPTEVTSGSSKRVWRSRS